MSAVARGTRALRRLLLEETFDVRTLDLEQFGHWLDRHLARWRHDPIFQQRVRIRELRRGSPRLLALERALREAARRDRAAPGSTRLDRLRQELIDTDKALAGLTEALTAADGARRRELGAKLRDFRTKRRDLVRERADLLAASPERRELLRIEQALARARASTGLEQAEEQLAALLRQQGQRSGRSGQSFESRAAACVDELLLPELARSSRRPDALAVLEGVTLRAARVEFDRLVVRRPSRPDRPVTVLAVVEVKRNINDLAHGYLRRRENLAWLTGDRTGYHSGRYRTSVFRSGHFDRPAEHHAGSERFHFTPASFRLFADDNDDAAPPRRLYLVTRRGPLWGLPGQALLRVAHRVATDEHGSLERWFRWCSSLAAGLQAPDVLRLYASTPARARQVLVLER